MSNSLQKQPVLVNQTKKPPGGPLKLGFFLPKRQEATISLPDDSVMDIDCEVLVHMGLVLAWQQIGYILLSGFLVIFISTQKPIYPLNAI